MKQIGSRLLLCICSPCSAVGHGAGPGGGYGGGLAGGGGGVAGGGAGKSTWWGGLRVLRVEVGGVARGEAVLQHTVVTVYIPLISQTMRPL